ncbi:hypothetical protein [Kitasatospora sp. GP82]|uniref:hypothetical protein n=1 Tax=Kitasatospora sp. GP82 TaxID=3035089 RepID=UPI002476841A|nr:hypothetical protein [Kitasatospora sp. GP82]MDH6127578.1 hypothetical protein [Kitasatospora sp. GP82]
MDAFDGRALPEDLDPDAWLWLPGMDYAAGRREARDEADAVNALLAELGVERAELRAVADTDAEGRGMVRLVGVPSGWRRLELLLTLARESGGPALGLVRGAASSGSRPATWRHRAAP